MKNDGLLLLGRRGEKARRETPASEADRASPTLSPFSCTVSCFDHCHRTFLLQKLRLDTEMGGCVSSG